MIKESLTGKRMRRDRQEGEKSGIDHVVVLQDDIRITWVL